MTGCPASIVVSGPSGAGKSTVLARVLRGDGGPALLRLPHHARGPRPGEKDGRRVPLRRPRRASRACATRAQFLEWAEVHGQLYGTARVGVRSSGRASGVDLLLDLDVQGAAQVREAFPDAVTVFILPPSYPALERRLRGRGPDDEAQLPAPAARPRGEELRLYREYDYAIVNDDLDGSVEDLKAVIRAARCRTSRVEPLAQRILGTFPPREES